MGNGNGNRDETTTTTTAPPRSILERIGGLFLTKSAQARIDKNKEAEGYSERSGGNPCHYQTHVGDKQGKARQPRKSGITCHHRKS